MSDESPEELEKKLRALEALHVRLGLPSLEKASRIPNANLKMPASRLAMITADNICASSPPQLFQMGDDIVTIDEGTGRVSIMDALSFVTFVEEFQICWKVQTEDGKLIPISLRPEMARVILKSWHFRAKLPRLRG